MCEMPLLHALEVMHDIALLPVPKVPILHALIAVQDRLPALKV